MKVNGIDISTFKAKLMSRTITTPEFNTVYQWGTDSLNYYYSQIGTDKFRTLKMKLDIICSNANELEVMKTKLVRELQETSIKFDDIEYNYNGFLVKEPSFTYIMKGNETIDVELLVVAEKDEVTVTIPVGTTSKSIDTGGTSSTPCIIEVTPTTTVSSLTIGGLSSNILMEDLVANRKYIINGYNGTVTENGVNCFSKVDLWELPKLYAKYNNITINSSYVKVVFRFNPRL